MNKTIEDPPLPKRYVGRFAPSPSGPMHKGSLVAAMASLLDARAHEGLWRLRIEDADSQRSVPGAERAILLALEAYGLAWDGAILRQKERTTAYLDALRVLRERDLIYACTCSRREVADSGILARDGSYVYPGTCREGPPKSAKPAGWRVKVPDLVLEFRDRGQGRQSQNVGKEVGDFVLQRADGVWAYQLAVVVDDAEQEITDVVRGADLLASTARQMYLQRILGLPTPRYFHVPLVVNAAGEKLSKQTGACALAQSDILATLEWAGRHLGLGEIGAASALRFWELAIPLWKKRYGMQSDGPALASRVGKAHGPSRAGLPKR